MAGDHKEEFDRLAFAHFRELRRVALRVCEDRETAEDLVQETYLRAWRSFDKFERGTNCRAWLFRIFFYVRSCANNSVGSTGGKSAVIDYESYKLYLRHQA